MEIETSFSFEKFRLDIEHVHNARFADVSTISKDDLKGIVYLEVGYGEDHAFLIIFDGYPDKEQNDVAAYETYRNPQLLRYGNICITNSDI